MAILTLAQKDLRLLARDTRAAIILIAMPLVFIFVLGLALGEGFGQKPDDRLRVSVVDEDAGLPPAVSTPASGQARVRFRASRGRALSGATWSRLPVSASRSFPIAPRLRNSCAAANGRACLCSDRNSALGVQICSFLRESVQPGGINPFYRDGVDLAALDLEVLRDPTQAIAASIIEQVAQVTLLRVILPWMIGRAFDEITKQMPFAKPALTSMFEKYDLTAKTWAALTKSGSPPSATGGSVEVYSKEPAGLLHRGQPGTRFSCLLIR